MTYLGSERKIRILFVITDFVQGGSERYLYEVCKALNKDKFEIEILTRKHIRPKDYYYFKFRDMGFVIHRKLSLKRYLRRVIPNVFKHHWEMIVDFIHSVQLNFELKSFLKGYDLISIIQIENYYQLQPLLKKDDLVVIHLMSNRFQYDFDIYAKCLPENNYRFILMDPDQKNDLVDTTCQNADIMYLPLAMDLRGRKSIYSVSPKSNPVKIGVFMRLSSQRPIEPLFHCFHNLVKDIYVNATLHCYGMGNPTRFKQLLESLNIHGKVFFEGHQRNIEETLKRDNLTLVWMTIHNPIMGYASIEVGSFGIPIVFWNMGTLSHERILAKTRGAVHSFSTVSEFVRFNRDMFFDAQRLKCLGEKVREYICSEYEIRRHINVLEDYYVSLAKCKG